MPLHPDFPVVAGPYQITRHWSLKLPAKFNRRFEDRQLVLWRPGLTAWIIVWNNDHSETQEQRLADIRGEATKRRTNESVIQDGPVLRFSYELRERDRSRTPSQYVGLYSHSIAEAGHVQMALYGDAAKDLKMAYAISKSVTVRPAV